MQIFSPAEVAKLMHLTDRTVRRWLKSGVIPGRKIGRLWYVEEEAPRQSLSRSVLIFKIKEDKSQKMR